MTKREHEFLTTIADNIRTKGRILRADPCKETALIISEGCAELARLIEDYAQIVEGQ